LENVYNPLIHSEKQVSNSLQLGTDFSAQHIMLTGPHGCGKTTIMKTIAYAYILGQSILLVPATNAHISPLTKIGTYLNVADNFSKGLSSFMAERQQMDTLRALANNVTASDRCLIIVDEPYAKTVQTVGEELVYNFILELYNNPQLTMLVASHFEKPALLEQKTKRAIVNYQPELLEPQPGSFIRTFKIIPGKARWWFENPQRRSDFVEWLATHITDDLNPRTA
jgi:DNA mismatch repair ATPase MutS